MRFLLAALVSLLSISLSFAHGHHDLRKSHQVGETSSPGSRAAALVAEMTLEEKIMMLHGSTGPYVGNVPENPRLGIPPIRLQDGPQGVGDGLTQVTAWPSALTVVASWDTHRMQEFATGMAYEQMMKGTNVLLGPMVNIARVPTGGRNFESMGEDPHLASRMAAANVQGIQSQPMIACVKHYLDNNQEFNRNNVSANVDDRTQHELYFPAFEAAVKAGVLSAMCSYNRVNGTFACEHESMNKHLKQEMGFQGWVMSDWYATHSTIDAVNNGLDMQMPDGSYLGDALTNAVQEGQISVSRIDDMTTRILTSMFAAGLFDEPPNDYNTNQDARSTQHNLLARKLAESSAILLKNQDEMLPLDYSKLKSIAVIGDQLTVTGSGSGSVIAPYISTPFDAISARVKIRPSNCEFDVGYDYKQLLNPSVAAANEIECCHECSASSSCNFFTYVNGTCWLKSTNDGRVECESCISGGCLSFQPPTVTYTTGWNIDEAVSAAKQADVAIVVVAVSSTEGFDRADLSLGGNQDALVEAILASQPNTVVVVRSPGAVTMPWASKAPSILAQLMAGQEAGNALAALLFGDVNPSGKLPLTFPNSMSEIWLTSTEQYPGVNGETEYTEGLYVGYRWYDLKQIEPLFPFGHGLSYTTFSYSNVSVHVDDDTVSIQVQIKNEGKRSGAEVVQVYLGYPATADEPVQQLRAFQKVNLLVGESQVVEFELDERSRSIWNVGAQAWQRITGIFHLGIGSSSRDIRIRTSFRA